MTATGGQPDRVRRLMPPATAPARAARREIRQIDHAQHKADVEQRRRNGALRWHAAWSRGVHAGFPIARGGARVPSNSPNGIEEILRLAHEERAGLPPLGVPGEVEAQRYSQFNAPPFWYSMMRVSKKFFSFFRSIASDIQGNGFSASSNTRGSPNWAQRRLAMKCM